MGSIKDRISINCSDKAIHLSEHLPVTHSIVWAEMTRVQANMELDLEVKRNEILHSTYGMVSHWSLLCYRLSWVKIKSR